MQIDYNYETPARVLQWFDNPNFISFHIDILRL